jgi:uncharacterized membrane protein YhhN
MNLLIVAAAAALLALTLFFESRGQWRGYLGFKTILSLLFVTTALVQPHPLVMYATWILVGLVLCLAGDVLLAVPGQRAFRLGLGAFLLGHLAYVLAFMRISTPNGLVFWTGTVIVLGASALVFGWLEPFLGRLRGAVRAYVAVISLMLIGALAVAVNPGLRGAGRALIATGALLFYVSDLFVARHRFVRPQFANRLYGLPLYYAGQFMLAFSVGLVL